MTFTNEHIDHAKQHTMYTIATNWRIPLNADIQPPRLIVNQIQPGHIHE